MKWEPRRVRRGVEDYILALQSARYPWHIHRYCSMTSTRQRIGRDVTARYSMMASVYGRARRVVSTPAWCNRGHSTYWWILGAQATRRNPIQQRVCGDTWAVID